MAKKNHYIIESGGGPIFEQPYSTVKQYSKNTNCKAKNIDNQWDYIDNILTRVGALSNDFESIKRKIRELGNDWNSCISIDNVGVECLFLDDLDNDSKLITTIFENEKKECNSVIQEFEETIQNINQWLDNLNKNYNEYTSILQKKNWYLNKLNSTDKSDSNYSVYKNKLNDFNHKLDDYRNISNPLDYGDWWY